MTNVDRLEFLRVCSNASNDSSIVKHLGYTSGSILEKFKQFARNIDETLNCFSSVLFSLQLHQRHSMSQNVNRTEDEQKGAHFVGTHLGNSIRSTIFNSHTCNIIFGAFDLDSFGFLDDVAELPQNISRANKTQLIRLPS